MLGAVDAQSPALLTLGAFIAKNVVHGNRAGQEWLLDWKDIKVRVRDGRVVGLTTDVGLTKVDRLQRGETKPLQCLSGCEGMLQLNDDGELDLASACPVHLLLAAKEKWAEALNVEVDDMEGGLFADYYRFEDVPAGMTLVAVDANSPAYNAKPKAAVKIITHDEERAGKRYMGKEDLVDGNGKSSRPPVGVVCFEVEGQPYACHVWGDAAGATARMRVLAIAAQKRAKAAGSELPFGNAFKVTDLKDVLSSRVLRRTMATNMCSGHGGVANGMMALMRQGGWSKASTAMKYVEEADPLATLGSGQWWLTLLIF